MKTRIFFLMIFLIVLTHASAQKTITGKVVDASEVPLPGVNCVLMNPADSVRITLAITEADGTFNLPAEEDEEYALQFSFIGYKTITRLCRVGDLGKIVMKEDAQQLEEIVVTSQLLKTFGNKDQLFLTESAKKTGNNALDAIASLPQFKQGVGSSELTTTDNKTILVLVDGIRSSSRELMLLKADDIKSISYYSNPPARYAHENVGAVIDVATRRKREKQYSLYLDTKNGVTTGYGTNLLSMSYRDSLNSVTAAYFIDYRALDDNIMNNAYIYPDKANNYRGLSGSYKGQYHIGQMTYQRYQGKHLFNAKVEYRKSPATQKYGQQLTNQGGEELTNNRVLESDYSSVAADLYYMYMFSDARTLSLNAVNTYYASDSDNELAGNSSEYSFRNHTDNKSYSLITEALYTDRIGSGDLNIGFYYQYKNLNQKYNYTNRSTVNTQKEYLYADYSNSIGKLFYNIGIGLENNHYRTAADESFNYWVFRPSVSLNMQCNQYTSMRLMASVKSAVPEVGNLTNSTVTVDEHYYTQGNTGLKPFYYYDTRLALQYASGNGKWYLSPSVSYAYYPENNMPVFFFEGEDVIQRMTKVDNVHELGASFSFSYKPVSWITFRPYYNYEYSSYQTPNQSISHSLHNVGISLQLLPKNWQISWFGCFPMTDVNGDIFQKYGFNMTASVLYKYKSISVGAEYAYNPNPSRYYTSIGGFSMVEETKWNNFKDLIAVKFTYYSRKGKSRSHAGKRISNADNDSGLTKYNTAK